MEDQRFTQHTILARQPTFEFYFKAISFLIFEA